MDRPDRNPSVPATRRETGIVQRLRASLTRGPIVKATPHILIGCSGGLDSVVLVHLLHGLVRTGSIRATIVHVDHRVRDDSADAARLVESLGKTLDMSVYVVDLRDDVLATHTGTGPEEALRRERYRAFAGVAADAGADAVALAHHQRDQAETVLLHLIRGAGFQGASGMREWTSIQVPWWQSGARPMHLRLWRPLLTESIDELTAIHREANLPLAEDSTNIERTYRRNAIRHDILPELERIAPGAIRNLARFAGIAAVDDDYLEHLAAKRLRHQQGSDLDRRAITDADLAIQRRVVRKWLLNAGFDGDLSSDRIDAVRDLANRNRSGSLVEIGGSWSVTIEGGVLSLRRASGYH